MSISISKITAEQTWDLRHRVMWANKPLDYIKLPSDQYGEHYGLWLDDKLVSVVSVFINETEAQFRKLATETELQRKGYATSLLNHVFDLVKEKQVKKIWCNARSERLDFYKNFGMAETNETYEKDGVDYVIMEKTFS